MTNISNIMRRTPQKGIDMPAPIFWWALNDSNSGVDTVIDESGNINASSSPGVIKGVSGVSVNTNSAYYLSYPNIIYAPNFINLPTNFLISIWVLLDYPSYPLDNLKSIFYKGLTTVASSKRLTIYINSSGTLVIGAAKADGTMNIAGVSALPDILPLDGKFHHIVGIFESGVGLRLYLDNKKIINYETTEIFGTNNNPFEIGRLAIGSLSARFLKGKVDEPVMYNLDYITETEDDIVAYFFNEGLGRNYQEIH